MSKRENNVGEEYKGIYPGKSLVTKKGCYGS